MKLVERDDALQQLKNLLDQSSEGSGRVALVRGEAGIGKTSVVQQFVAGLDDAHVLWGGCDDLLAARPLGPLWDMAFDEPSLDAALRTDDRQETFRAVMELLTRSLRPTVMVIEDMHWADNATLDLIKLIGRRVDRTHGLIVITYRDGETPGDHPLRVALGDLPHGVVERIALKPLTLDGVRDLAGGEFDPDALWEMTGGNPFFVSEAVATAGETVPVSIRDAVNARVRRLSEAGRALVELASIAPSRIELEVVTSVLGDSAGAIAECEEAGILEVAGDSLKFRHELARRAVEGELPTITRRQLNMDVLSACESLDSDVSKCAHHAREAGDPEAILRILPEAARRASAVESHAEALSTLQALEPYLDAMTTEQLADHYDHRAYEEYLAADRGLELAERAVDLRRQMDDKGALANSLLTASRIAWVGTNRALAQRYAEEAAIVAGDVGGDRLAMSYSVLSQLAMLGGFADEAIEWGEKALALVDEGDSPIRAHALNNIGSARMMKDVDHTEELMESRRIAAKVGSFHDETRACVNLAWNYLMEKRLDEADHWIDQALKVTTDMEMPSFETYTWVERAMWHEMRGEWDESERICSDIFEQFSSLRTSQAESAILLAKMAIRRGNPVGLDELVSDGIERAEFSEEAQRLGPAYAMVAEHVWAGGKVEPDTIARAKAVMEICFERLHEFFGSEIAFWLKLAGHVEDMPEMASEPYALLDAGQWREAADWWSTHGIPYEQAVALSLGDVEAKLEALTILDDLGAALLASRIRSGLQSEGVKGVPRGPQKATRDHDLGLTARQADVLELLANDLTNAEIADRLFISTRTVDHHVSAILTKLGASSRSEAAQYVTKAS